MQLYNTMTRSKEPFIPAGEVVGLYACGITAYDLCHIGHGRSAVVFDVLVRYLRETGHKVNFVRNFTDVDDKIIKRAGETGKTSTEVAEENIAAFHTDMDALGVVRADHEPRCTEYIPQMVTLTQQLIDKGHAYATPSGDVYFRVRSFEGYGKLSGRDIDEMRSGARVAPGDEKEDPLDFALWKAAKPGEPSWESPWGQGRPGWHLECSAMSGEILELPLDIHGGGQDLIFPHHENEIAQSEALMGTQMARFWVHNGFVQINSEKMSKSLGNFFTIREILQSFLPEVTRYFLISTHYRSPLDFSDAAMREAEKGMRRIYTALAAMREQLDARAKWSGAPMPTELTDELAQLERGFDEAMADDLNTARALGQLFSMVRLAGRVLDDKSLKKSQGGKELFLRVLANVACYAKIFGVFGNDPATFLTDLRDMQAKRAGIDVARVQGLLDERADARSAKDFEASDRLRDELAAMGVLVKDGPTGQAWSVQESGQEPASE